MIPVSFHKVSYLRCVEEKNTLKSEFAIKNAFFFFLNNVYALWFV